ncbi:MAG: hypothetical protein ABIW17_00435 [Marmoricola sp.]
MVNAGPDTVGTVLDQIVAEVAALATEKSDQVRAALDAAGRDLAHKAEEAEKLPADVVKRIKDLCDPPDYWSLLLFVLVKISELDPHLSVGTMNPDGWSRMVTVTWTGDGPDAVRFTAGLAVTDPDLKHGIMLKASAPLDLAFGSDLRVEVTAQDNADWTWEFGGSVESPDASAVLEVGLSWKPPIPALSNDVGGVSIGPLHLNATFARSPTEPLYKLALGLGVAADPGLRAQLHAGRALGVLGQIVHVADLDEQYSPQVALADGQEPLFTLGHSGL